MYRRYYSVNDMPQMLTREEKEKGHQKSCEEIHIEKKPKPKDDKGFLSKLETDDIILIAIALLLLADDCDDKMLLIAIAFIFISGIL